MALDPQLAGNLIFIFGITNIIGVFLILTTCRCMGLANITNRFFQHTWYQKYYNHHCAYWWFFLLSVLLHSSLAIYLFRI